MSRHLFFEYVLNHPVRVIVLSLLAAIVLSSGVAKLSVANDFRVYFSDENPQLKNLERLEDVFTRQDNVFLIVAPKDGDIFDRQTLELVWELTEAAWQLPYARRAGSMANFQYTIGRDDELITEALIEDPSDLTAERIAELRRIALSDPRLVNSLVGPGGDITGVYATLTYPEDDLTASDEVIAAARGLLAQYGERYPEIDFHLGGSATMNVVLGEAVRSDIQTLVALSYAIILVGLFLFLRSFAGTFACFVLITLSIGATMGLAGWLGRTLTPVAGFAPSIVMTIAVADAVHLLTNYFIELGAGRDRKDAMRESLRINAGPIFITSFTTIIGVLSLNFSDSPPYRDLGNLVAFGVFVAFALSLTFVPALMMLSPGRAGKAGLWLARPVNRLAEAIIAHQRLLLIGSGVIIAVTTSFIFKNDLTERWHEYFDHSFAYRQTLDLVDEKLSGLDRIEYMLDTGQADGINDPAYLAALDGFAAWFREQPEVASVDTISDTIKRLNKNMHNDDDAYYRIPESRQLAAQYLLLYELSLPLGQGLETVINVDRSATRFGATLHAVDSNRMLEINREARAWLEQNAPSLADADGTGLDIVFAHMNQRNIRGLLIGTFIALAFISVVLIAALRSVRLGLVSLIPNLAPAAVAYGIWGIVAGYVNVALSVVIALSLGIVVDDTVHFLSKYLRARREHGLDATDGVRHAFRRVGPALTITSAVLVTGFMVLAASHFNPTRETGTLLSATLAIALIVDFLFLPPLLIWLDKR